MSKTNHRRSKLSGKNNANSPSRQQIANQAAKLLASGNAKDYESAKLKAAKQLGIKLEGPLPSDTELDESLSSYQKLFNNSELEQRAFELRQLATRAMELLEKFSPRLVGGVQTGFITKSSPVILLVFADPLEDIDIFLIEKSLFLSKQHYKV